jgi:hypothetical protein
MAVELEKQACPPYLRSQAGRRRHLSRNRKDIGTERDLRLMAEEYYRDESQIQTGLGARTAVGI